MAETTEEYRNRINEIANSVGNELYLKDMRDNIAEGISKTGNRQADIEDQFQEVIDNTTGKDVISAPELIAARNGETNLKARLDKEQQQVNAQLAQTMSQTEFDSWVATLLDGGPSIFMETVSALQTAYPNGSSGVALVRETNPAKIYVWNGTDWQSFGDYQGFEIKDNTVIDSSISRTYDLLKSSAATSRIGRMTGYDLTTNEPLFNTESSYTTYKLPIPAETGELRYPLKSDMPAILSTMFVNANNERVFAFSANAIKSNETGESWIIYTDELVTVDLKGLAERSSYLIPSNKPTHVYISFMVGDINYVNGISITDLSEFESLKPINATILEDNSVTSNKLTKTIKEDLNNYELVLPSKVPVVIGRQLNVYYENILLNGMLDDVTKVTAQQSDLGGSFYENVWQVKPSYDVETIKTCPFRLYANDLNTVTQTKQFEAIFIPETASTGNLTAMIIGDSKVDNGKIVSELVNLFNADSSTDVTFQGSRGTAPALHEGRSGWSAETYCTQASYNGMDNGFWNPDTSQFDFSYLMSSKGYTGVDAVVINLGTNDAVNTADYDLIIEYYNEMIASIKEYNPNVKILIGLTENMSPLKSSFTLNKNRILSFTKKLIETYDNRENENIYTIPLYMNINLYLDYNFNEVAESDRNPTIVKKIADEVHQNEYGYLKNADMIYSAIKYAFI